MLNYSAHAITDIVKNADALARMKHTDAFDAFDFVRQARRAQKFVVPDRGSLLYDAAKIPEGLGITRLPFPQIVIEVPFSQDEKLAENVFESSRRVILAQEVAAVCGVRGWSVVNDGLNPNMIRIDVACWVDSERHWFLQPTGVLVEIGVKSIKAGKATGDPFLSNRMGDVSFPLLTYPRCRTISEELRKQYGNVGFEHIVSNDVGTEVRILAEMLAALSCRNVSTEIERPPEKLTKARIKSGREPFYDVHMLVVGGERLSGSTSARTDEQDGFKVRQHLRRGHIRNLANGDRVWVNQTIVAAGSPHGLAHKTYVLR